MVNKSCERLGGQATEWPAVISVPRWNLSLSCSTLGLHCTAPCQEKSVDTDFFYIDTHLLFASYCLTLTDKGKGVSYTTVITGISPMTGFNMFGNHVTLLFSCCCSAYELLWNIWRLEHISFTQQAHQIDILDPLLLHILRLCNTTSIPAGVLTAPTTLTLLWKLKRTEHCQHAMVYSIWCSCHMLLSREYVVILQYTMFLCRLTQ